MACVIAISMILKSNDSQAHYHYGYDAQQPRYATSSDTVAGSPQRIIISRASIDLPIQEGTYDSKTAEWTISDSSANYATNTFRPNTERGTTLLYGHDLPHIFSNIRQLKKGDEVSIHTDNNYAFIYRYKPEATRTIQPDNTSLFSDLNTEKPRLILLTCEGVWSQTRLLMEFELMKATKL